MTSTHVKNLSALAMPPQSHRPEQKGIDSLLKKMGISFQNA
jgi:hypothetical protein